MSLFVRPAPWLRQLFTPAHTPQPNPGTLSEDVSLVQPYDGSGWAIPNPETTVRSFTAPAGAQGNNTILTMGATDVGRILGISVNLNAGAAPTHANAAVRAPGTNLNCPITDVVVPVTGIFIGLPHLASSVILPRLQLEGSHIGGDAATILIWRVYIAICPIGTVFYV